MQVNVFGALVAKPISFPDDLQFSIFPLRHDGSQVGGSYSLEDHQSWDWVQRTQPPLDSEKLARIKTGESVSVRVGWIKANFCKGTTFPKGTEFEILES